MRPLQGDTPADEGDPELKTKPRIYAVAIGAWFILLVIAFAVGTVRELAFTKKKE
jgi:hypothetical protein